MCFFLNVVMFLKKLWRRCFWRCSSKHANDVNVRAKVVRSFSSTSNPLYIFSSALITSSTTPSINFWPSYRHCTPPLPASKIASYNNFHKKTFPMTKSVCMMFCVLMNIVKKHWHQYLFNNTAKILHRSQKAWYFRFLVLHTALWPKYWYSAKNVTLNSFYIHKIYYLNFII